jgi:hypothetical protein
MSKGTYSHSNRHRMHEPPRYVPFVIYEARNMGKGFWKEMQSYRQTVDELQQENEELTKDKERLDWLLKELDEFLYGEVSLETREDIDEVMNQPTQ